MRKIILASTSPRRAEVMRLSGLRFSIKDPLYAEDMSLTLPPVELVKKFAAGKAESVANRIFEREEALVIGADSIVVAADGVFGKPADAADAKRMLKVLSGTVHKVVTGYAIVESFSGGKFVDAVSTEVYFRPLSEKEIDAYVASGAPMDKAGAYGIQDRSAVFVEKIVGDFYNVVGLPLCSLTRALAAFGVSAF